MFYRPNLSVNYCYGKRGLLFFFLCEKRCYKIRKSFTLIFSTHVKPPCPSQLNKKHTIVNHNYCPRWDVQGFFFFGVGLQIPPTKRYLFTDIVISTRIYFSDWSCANSHWKLFSGIHYLFKIKKLTVFTRRFFTIRVPRVLWERSIFLTEKPGFLKRPTFLSVSNRKEIFHPRDTYETDRTPGNRSPGNRSPASVSKIKKTVDFR